MNSFFRGWGNPLASLALNSKIEVKKKIFEAYVKSYFLFLTSDEFNLQTLKTFLTQS